MSPISENARARCNSRPKDAPHPNPLPASGERELRALARSRVRGSREATSGPREVQLDQDIVVVGEEQLVDRRLRDVVLAGLGASSCPPRLGPVQGGRDERGRMEPAGG